MRELEDMQLLRMLCNYFLDLAKEFSFAIIFLLGIGSTVSTYIPKLQSYMLLKWIGIFCVLIGFVGANFRLYTKLAIRVHRRQINDLVDELEANHRILQSIQYSTAPALRNEAWGVVFEGLDIPDDLRSQINNCYMNVRSAKDIHQSIQSVPRGANVTPEQIKIEEHLQGAKKAIPNILKRLREIADLLP